METQSHLYRGYLKGLLAERISRNPAYSLNALAAKAGVSRGFLSEVLNGKKNLSPDTAARIARRLELPTEEADRFRLLVQVANASDPDYRAELLEKLGGNGAGRPAYDLSVDAFRVIAEWYHLPIVAMAGLEGFQFNARNVARRLGISVLEADAAIDRLLRVELIEKHPHGGFSPTQEHYLAQSEFHDEAVARFHRQILEKLMPSLTTQKKNERLSRTQVLLLDPAVLPRIEAVMDRAAEEAVALAAKSKKKSRVCALALHLFNLIPERKAKP